MRRAAGTTVLAAASLFVLISFVAASAAETGPRLVDADGLKIVVRRADGPLAAACVFVGTGSACETPEKTGVTSLLNGVALSAGPATELERLGGRAEVYTGSGYSCFRLIVPVKNLAPALGILGRAVTAPALDDTAVRAGKRGLACRAGIAGDTPVEHAYRSLLIDAYPGGPSGPCTDGGSGPAGRLTADDLEGWHAAYYVRGNVVVSLCADMDAETAKKLAVSAFAGLRPGRRAQAVTYAAHPRAAGGAREGGTTPRSVAMVGYPAPPVGSPDYAAMRVALASVADGMGSSLFRAYRLDGKLAYSFGGVFPEVASGTRLTFYVDTDTKRIDRAVQDILGSVGAIKREELGASGLARARARAAGALRMESEGVAGLAWMDGLAEMLGVGQGYWDELADRIEGVGADDLARAADRYMGTHTVVVVPSGTTGG